jgi:hypothetical protein
MSFLKNRGRISFLLGFMEEHAFLKKWQFIIQIAILMKSLASGMDGTLEH